MRIARWCYPCLRYLGRRRRLALCNLCTRIDQLKHQFISLPTQCTQLGQLNMAIGIGLQTWKCMPLREPYAKYAELASKRLKAGKCRQPLGLSIRPKNLTKNLTPAVWALVRKIQAGFRFAEAKRSAETGEFASRTCISHSHRVAYRLDAKEI